MKIAETIVDMTNIRQQLAEPIGYVPTMGSLHEGHLALVRRTKAENSSVVVSIFVNPTQFSPQEDFEKYPRDQQLDLIILEKEKVNAVFIPSVSELYPPQFDSWVEVGKLTERLEGASRPNHFRGVTTIVNKLFNIIQPNRSYFGQKDAQQTIVIKKMVADLDMNLEVVTVPTVRDPDGLAMSSRNIYLSTGQRKAATVLHQALTLAQQLYSQGERDAEKIRQQMKSLIKKQPLANIDYVSVANADTLDEQDKISSPSLASLAVKIGATRLIDNVILE